MATINLALELKELYLATKVNESLDKNQRVQFMLELLRHLDERKDQINDPTFVVADEFSALYEDLKTNPDLDPVNRAQLQLEVLRHISYTNQV